MINKNVVRKHKTIIKYYTVVIALLMLIIQCTNCAQNKHNKVPPGFSKLLPSIFGEPDLTPINMDDFEKTPLARAVGIFLKQYNHMDRVDELPGCSGIQISRRHVLTAAHCKVGDFIFDKGRLAKGNNQAKIHFSTIGGFVSVNYPAQLIDNYPDPQLRWQVSGPVFANRKFDYAVFESETPMDEASIDLSNATEQIEDLAVIGFPGGLPLFISEDCQGMSRPGHRLFRHSCDTLPGSSGGLVINPVTGFPVGMHTGGSSKNDPFHFEANGKFETIEDFANARGCLPELYPDTEKLERCLMLRVMNRGVFFSTIAESLAEKAPDLWNEILYWQK